MASIILLPGRPDACACSVELLAKAESHLIQTGGGNRTNIRAHLSDRDGRLTVTASRFIPLEAAAGREAGMHAVLEQRAPKLGTVSSQRWPRTTGSGGLLFIIISDRNSIGPGSRVYFIAVRLGCLPRPSSWSNSSPLWTRV